MKFFASLVLAQTLLLAPAQAADSAPKYPPQVISNSELRVLPKSPTGRQYQLHVGLPASYAKETNKKYPVVYVTDGYWDLQKITVSEGCLWYDRVAPEFITVGIGYPGTDLDYGKMRTWELTPVPMPENGDSGHAADFLKSIETEIIPFIEREYRVDTSFRVMSGASLGGLFTLYAMYTKPEPRSPAMTIV